MRTSKNTTKLHLYKSLDTLKILTFWRILDEQNACLLDFDYFEEKTYTDEEKFEIEQTFIRLYDEFYLLRDNVRHKHDVDKGFEQLKIDAQIFNIYHNKEALLQIKSFVGLLPEETINDAIEQTYKRIKGLTGIGSKIKIGESKTLDENISILERVLNSLENTKNLNATDREKAVKKEIKNVYEIVGWVEAELDRNLPIDDIVCSRWIVYENQAIERRKIRYG